MAPRSIPLPPGANAISAKAWVHLQLEGLQQKFPLIGDVRGIGLLWGVKLVKNRKTKEKAVQEAETVMYECLHHGLSFKVSQGNVLQLSPPLIITRAQLSEALTILEHALAATSV